MKLLAEINTEYRYSLSWRLIALPLVYFFHSTFVSSEQPLTCSTCLKTRICSCGTSLALHAEFLLKLTLYILYIKIKNISQSWYLINAIWSVDAPFTWQIHSSCQNNVLQVRSCMYTTINTPTNTLFSDGFWNTITTYVSKAGGIYTLSHVNPKFLKDITASPVKQRRICLISMYELFGYPATWLCNFPIACRCISEQRPDLCKCHFISLAVQA